MRHISYYFTVIHRYTFPNQLGGGAEDVKCSRYHQNPAKIGFLFRFDSVPCHYWGQALPKRYKVMPLLLCITIEIPLTMNKPSDYSLYVTVQSSHYIKKPHIFLSFQTSTIMEAMDFDPETLLATGSSDPMLGKPAEQAPAASHEQQAQQPPSGQACG